MAEIINLGKVEEFGPENSKVINQKGKQIAVFKLNEKEVFAVDNKCPHQGFSLEKGTCKGHILACSYHNWKFDLRNGTCLTKNGKDVACYEIGIENNEILLNISNNEADVLSVKQKKAFSFLEEAVFHRNASQILNSINNLLEMKTSLKEIVLFGTLLACKKNKWGHNLAALISVVELTKKVSKEGANQLLSQAFWCISESLIGLKEKEKFNKITVENFTAARDNFLLACEEKDEAKAQGLFSWILETQSKETTLSLLLEMVTTHFYGYTHGLIYLVKAFELLDFIGWENAELIFSGFLTTVLDCSRGEKMVHLEEMEKLISENGQKFEELWQKQGKGEENFDFEKYFETLLNGTTKEIFEKTLQALENGTNLHFLIDAQTLAASERIIRFDLDSESKSQSILAVTHCLTHAETLRFALDNFSSYFLLREFLFSAQLINYCKKLDLEKNNYYRFSIFRRTSSVDLSESLSRFFMEKQHVNAMEKAYQIGKERLNTKPFFRKLLELTSKDLGDPHVLKMILSVFREYTILENSKFNFLLLCGLTKYLFTDLKNRKVYSASQEGNKFLVLTRN
ncbi:Rieske 2Fe-2S domain-containing protein [bacterium]|nr:Rieske 2Fe-2S domain-containing protein [bacterium]